MLKKILGDVPLTTVERVQLANPYHDAAGKFTTEDRAVFVSMWKRSTADPKKPVNPKARDIPELTEGTVEFEEAVSTLESHFQDLRVTWHVEAAGYGLRQYTGSNYETINGDLRAGVDPEKSLHGSIIESRDKTLSTAKLPLDLKLFRGAQGAAAKEIHEKFERGELIGSTVLDKGFLSTSMSREVAKSFAGGGFSKHSVIFNINAPKGTPGAYVEHISLMPGEYEVVLPRSTGFVIRRARKGDKNSLELDVDILR